MWIDKEIIPALIDATEQYIKAGLEALDLEPENFDVYDPNDLTIFDGFVLPVLKDKIHTGFESDEMIEKGFRFMVGLVQNYLIEYGSSLTRACLGKLIILYYQFYITEVRKYFKHMDKDTIQENIPNINNFIDQIQLNESIKNIKAIDDADYDIEKHYYEPSGLTLIKDTEEE